MIEKSKTSEIARNWNRLFNPLSVTRQEANDLDGEWIFKDNI